MLLERETTIWSTADQVREAMERLVAFYRDSGFRKASFAIDQLVEHGRDDAIANIVWTIERSDGRAS